MTAEGITLARSWSCPVSVALVTKRTIKVSLVSTSASKSAAVVVEGLIAGQDNQRIVGRQAANHAAQPAAIRSNRAADQLSQEQRAPVVLKI